MKQFLYPFSAIVAQDAMKTALVLNAIDPSVGGVLIRGHKGTGKSTAARALAQLLPSLDVVEGCPFNSDPRAPLEWKGIEVAGAVPQGSRRAVLRAMPFVELPLNATEDRLVGSLHVETVLQTGRRTFAPGLLAAANRGILYVDEVNLLDDHLVDMLLDAAASGLNVVEREGISFVHPARILLIGTMNPEEGELRPQFLDRFGLCVVIESVTDLDQRRAIVQRHLAFEKNPEGFLGQWESADRLLSNRIARARGRLSEVSVPEKLIELTVGLTRRLKLQGHRADLTIIKAARAHAALMDKKVAGAEDVLLAARLSVPHRLKSSPLESTANLRQKIDDALEDVMGNSYDPEKKDELPDDEESLEEMAERMQVPSATAAGSILFSHPDEERTTVFAPDRNFGAAEIEVQDLLAKGKHAEPKTIESSGAGRYVGDEAMHAGEQDCRIAVDATLRQAAMRVALEGIPAGTSGVQQEDLRKKQFEKPSENLIVFVVDSSESMGAGVEVRMKAAKGAVLALLRTAYRNRSEVAMVVFGGEQASVVLPPTSSVEVANSALEDLPTGGATPFGDGLWRAWQLIRSERLKNAGIRPILVIISDGEANVPISEGADPLVELGALAEKIGLDQIPAVFIDVSSQLKTEADMKRVAGRMRANYVTIRELTAQFVLDALCEQGTSRFSAG